MATSNCIGPTAASTGAWSPRSGSRSTCTTPSSSSWAMPRRNCLNRPVSVTRALEKCSGRSSGCRGKLDGRVDVERVADPHVGGVDETDDVAGERLLDGLALLAEQPSGRTWWRRACRCVPWVTTMPRSKRPEQTRKKAMRSRCDGSMLACTLKTKPEKGASSGRGTSSSPTRGVGDGHEVDDRVEQHADAEVGQGGAEEDRRGLARQEGLGVERRRRRRRAGRARPGPWPRPRPPRRPPGRRSTSSSGASVAPWPVRVKRVKPPSRAGRRRRGSRRRCRPAR